MTTRPFDHRPESDTPGAVMAPQPAGLFLVGAERSGTTMLRLMLGHHPDLAWQNEFEYAVDRLGDDGTPPALEAYRSYLGMHRVFRANAYEIDPGLDYSGLVRSFLGQCRERAGKPIVGATVHRHFDRILSVWPDARFIHLVRDPRDVAPSVIRMGWAGNVYHASERWIGAERAWDRVADRIAPSRLLELRFEDLLADPRGQLAHVCAFVGVPYDDAMLSFHEDTSYDPPDPSASQRWSVVLSERDVRLIEGRLGELAERRGYELSGLPPLHPGLLRRSALRIQNKVAHVRWNFDRYGVRLYIRAQLAKRFGSAAAWAGVKRELDEIDRGHLK
ncbi:MAG: sulfotransferase [Planctomycetota bacterium]